MKPNPNSAQPPGNRPAREKLDISAAAVQPLPSPPQFVSDAGALGIEFEPGDVEKLGLYLALLMKANETQNLTAIRDAAEAWRRHILDSLTLLPALAEFPEGSRVIDVGSGGGLPGLPLAIVMPHIGFTLLEATSKKCDFLTQAAARLGLSNVKVLCGRSERVAQDRGVRADSFGTVTHTGGHREAYDAVVSRAVGRLATLVELTAPLCRIGGSVLLIKGEKADEELKEAERAMHLLKVVHVETLPTPTGRIVILEKRSATPRDYPRADGEPARAPLGVTTE
ncbi:MAG: 16S rRNA (guanine(527)-N(7))-methyltransferase RsmG [Phycisphaerales bacterium]|nr:16S rRNA (guanine(527)-N(7))-methyltransferase RsmG [Planctomycetota bacterium]